MKKHFLLFLIPWCIGCSKNDKPATPPPPPVFSLTSVKINGRLPDKEHDFYDVPTGAPFQFSFSAPVDPNSVAGNITLGGAGSPGLSAAYANGDSLLILRPSSALQPLSLYTLTLSPKVRSRQQAALAAGMSVTLVTSIDSSDKFERVSDSVLLDKVQQQTFAYFWDLGHPVSGMARERNTSGDIVTTGGTGFGIMCVICAIHRNFISRADGLQRISKIVGFLKDKCTRYHGAFSHWINGASGATVPFSPKDDGADLVETSYLMQGLLCARQFFSTSDAGEVSLRQNINLLWDAVEWNWFRNDGQQVLYWHWSPDYHFEMNVPIKGWNEALITYVLAASSNTDSIPRTVYDNGWASNGAMKNGGTYYGVRLPLGPEGGGPLFFSHYSFLGINPHGLSDAYADYLDQNTSQSLINYNYCVANPGHYNGYSASIWGLTASDDGVSSYAAHSPTNDDGVITPSAAISSLPYTPEQSMDALRFFYYKLGDRIFKPYGFVDAFNLSDCWFADSFLAIDQGPEMVMIENYRSGLLWNLLMSCPEIKRGLRNLGFRSPYL